MDQKTNNTTESPILLARLEYAVRGWWTFCAKKSMKAAKHSGTPPGGMTTDENVIRAEFRNRRFRNQNVGIVTGSVSGIFVIETDTASMVMAWKAKLRESMGGHERSFCR
jgi:hypothetical protein